MGMGDAEVERRSTSLISRALRMEAGGWRSLYRWIAKKPRTSPGATAFAYTMPVVALFWTFIGVSVVEVVAVDFLLHRWPIARIALLLLGLWGVVFMAGMLAALKVNPHEVGPEGLVVRNGIFFDERLPWSNIASIGQRLDNLDSSKSFQMDGTALHVVIGSSTNLVVTLHEPIVVRLPDRDQEITELRFWADEPAQLQKRAKAAIG